MARATLKTVTLGIDTLAKAKARARAAFDGARQGAFISFVSVDDMWKILTPKRWDILRILTGAGPLAIREVARRADRDVKAVHGDVHALINAGLLERTETGSVEFPYDRIHVDFVVAA